MAQFPEQFYGTLLDFFLIAIHLIKHMSHSVMKPYIIEYIKYKMIYNIIHCIHIFSVIVPWEIVTRLSEVQMHGVGLHSALPSSRWRCWFGFTVLGECLFFPRDAFYFPIVHNCLFYNLLRVAQTVRNFG